MTSAVVYEPYVKSPIEIETEMEGITTNNACELVGIKTALQWIANAKPTNRLIVFSDSKYAINCVLNKTKPNEYFGLIKQTQGILLQLQNVPEIYYVKAHVGIAGNERADRVAKRAAKKAAQKAQTNNEMFETTNRNNVSNRVIESFLDAKFMNEWKRKWESNTFKDKHCFAKQIMPFVSQVLDPAFNDLTMNEMRIIARLRTGHTLLKHSMFERGMSKTYVCQECKNNSKDETIEHFLLECVALGVERQVMKRELQMIDSRIGNTIELNCRLLLTGFPLQSCEARKQVMKQCAVFVIETKERI